MRPRGQVKRKAIIAAAIEVIANQGVFGATTRKIAEAAGLNLATLHYQFVSKDEILLQVLSHLVEKNRHAVQSLIASDASINDKIEDFLGAIWSEISECPNEQLTLYHLTMHALSTEDKSIAHRKYDEYLQIYRDVLHDPDHVAQSEELANFVFTSVVGIILQWMASQDEGRAKRAIQYLVAVAQEQAARF